MNEQLSKTQIKAPISGSIDKKFIKEGEMLNMGKTAFRIVQLSRLKIEAKISERYVADIEKGDSVEVNFQSTGISFVSVVEAIAQVIDHESRTFTIEVDVPSSLKHIKPNMIADIKIYNYVADSALTIPMNIIQKNEDGRFIFVAEEESGQLTAKRRMVEIGRYNTREAEIAGGLQEGENVITDGYQNLSDNQPVKVVKSL